MAKHGFGRLLAITAVSSAVAAGITYILQYHSFHKELEKEFHNFEGEEEVAQSKVSNVPDRKYVALNADKDEFIVAAKETANAAKGMAAAAKGILKDVGDILLDNTSSIKSVYDDTSKNLKSEIKKDDEKLSEKKSDDKDSDDETLDNEVLNDESLNDDEDLEDDNIDESKSEDTKKNIIKKNVVIEVK